MSQSTEQFSPDPTNAQTREHNDAPTPRKEHPMHDQLVATVEREILTWPGINKVFMAGGDAPGGFHVPPATVYNLGRRHLGHIHTTGTVDLTFPRAVCDEVVASGKAIHHPAGLAGAVTTYLATEADIPNHRPLPPQLRPRPIRHRPPHPQRNRRNRCRLSGVASGVADR
jgi:hypothetical protein